MLDKGREREVNERKTDLYGFAKKEKETVRKMDS